MGEGSAAYRVDEPRVEERRQALGPRRPSAGELAWIGVIPCALVVLIAIVVLGPPLGGLLFPRPGFTFWSDLEATPIPPDPEPTEHARFLLALTAPLLLTGFVLLGVRLARPAPVALIAGLVRGTQVIGLVFVVTCVVVQHRQTFEELVSLSSHVVYFKPVTLVVAAAIAAAIAAGLASEAVKRRSRALLGESRGRFAIGAALACVAVAVAILPAINLERTIASANESVLEHIVYWLDEAFAVLNGRFPLVDYAGQYALLWTYPIAGAMALLGPSIGVYTVAVSVIGSGAMLAVFAVLRRVVRSTVAALLLFVPFLATSFFMMEGPLENRYAIVNLFSTFPLRYAGPFILVWLVARHLDGASPRRVWGLFVVAGLVVVNNVEFGIPALGATIAALLWSRGRIARAALLRAIAEATAGLLVALALVSVLTLATAGSLPHLELMFRLARVFAIAGWGMLHMTPIIGMSTIIYLTYVGAIGVATARAVDHEPDRLMTGLLAWSGVFGLGSASYYAGRSYPEVLTNLFPAWALCLTLLFVLAVRGIAARPAARPTLAEAACLVGFGVMVCSLPQMPRPWSEAARLRRDEAAIYAVPQGQPFIAAHTQRGERVAILTPLGHRAAYNLGIVDVLPYSGSAVMPTVEQFDDMLADLHAAGGRKVFLSVGQEWSGLQDALVDRGYRLVDREELGMGAFVRPS